MHLSNRGVSRSVHNRFVFPVHTQVGEAHYFGSMDVEIASRTCSCCCRNCHVSLEEIVKYDICGRARYFTACISIKRVVFKYVTILLENSVWEIERD